MQESHRKVGEVYEAVMQDVLRSIRQKFRDEGSDEGVLATLEELWRGKLRQHATVAGVNRSGAQAAQGTASWQTANVASGSVFQQSLRPFSQRDGDNGDDDDDDHLVDASIAVDDNDNAVADDDDDDAAAEAVDADQQPQDEEEEEAAGADGNDAVDSFEDEDEESIDSDCGDNTILALFSQIQRVKGKYTVRMNTGIMNLNGREYMFKECKGEFTW